MPRRRNANRNAETVAAIRDYFEEHGYPPSVRDVQHALGLMATSAAKARISDAATAGMIHVTPGIARGIALVD